MTIAPASGIETSGSFSPAVNPSRTPAGGGAFMWAVGVYAAPRAERTLFQTVASLRAAGMFAAQTGRSMWVVDPSPVSHIARHSTIPGHADNTGNRNALRPADHSRPLREQVFPACQAANSVHTAPTEEGD